MLTGPDILKPTIAKTPPALATTSDMADVMARVKASTETPTPAPAPEPSPAPAPPPTEAPAPAPEPAPAPAPPPAAAADDVEDPQVIRKPWFVKKIDKLNEKARAAEAKANAEAAERQRLEAEVAALRAPPPEPKPADDPQPKKADYQDPDTYIAEFAAWTARQEVRKEREATRAESEKRTKEQNERSARSQIEAVHTAHNKRVEEAKKDLPDFEQTALREDVNLRFDVFFQIEKSPMGPYLMYAIGKDPAIATKLNGLDPTDVMRELVTMENAIKETAARKVTKAKEPIEPLSKGGGGAPKSPEDMTMDEYEAYLTPILNQGRRPFAPAPRRKG